MPSTMHSTFQRLNHITSLCTTYVMILLGLISIASWLVLPPVNVGTVEIKDLIVQRGRLRRWRAREEDIATMRFDIRTDLNPLLNSYNTKQLFLYLTATYYEDATGETHDVVLWDRIIQRGDMRDIRAVGKKISAGKAGKRGRGNVRLEEVKNKYMWRNPSGTFKNIPEANMTLYYSLMPYVGIVSSGIAATTHGPIEIPEVIKR